MKYVTPDGKFWIEQKERNTFLIGITKKTLEKLGIILVFSAKQTPGTLIKQGMSLAAIETINQLGCLASPIDGILTNITGQQFEDDPTKINSTTPLFELKDATLPYFFNLKSENRALPVL